jgi:hypothetical protein
LRARGRRLPKERDWERSAVLEPRPGGRAPELISDGGGLPFRPIALEGPAGRLDPDDPAVGALIARLTARTAGAAGRGDTAPPPTPTVDDWRLLARTDGEALFGRGRPPRLFTMGVRLDARRGTWTCVGESAARPLRAAREGIRASSWRPDPSREVEPEDTVLRVLVTERTFSGGQRADGRVLAPEIYIDDQELVLTMFVAPKPGFQARTSNPETPVRVALPQPVGARRLIDGAIYDGAPHGTIVGGTIDRGTIDPDSSRRDIR